MAKIYKAPGGFDPPNFDYRGDWQAQERDYLERLSARAREQNPGDELAGTVVGFPYADGRAQYMVWSSKPLSLVHLELGDAWAIPEAHERGLRLSDIQQMVRRDAAMKAIFSSRSQDSTAA